MLTFQEFHKRALPVNTETEQLGILFQAVGLGGESGEFLNIVKKMVRDGWSVEKFNAALIEAGDILFYLRQSLHAMGFTMEEAAQAELDKLDAMRQADVAT